MGQPWAFRMFGHIWPIPAVFPSDVVWQLTMTPDAERGQNHREKEPQLQGIQFGSCHLTRVSPVYQEWQYDVSIRKHCS